MRVLARDMSTRVTTKRKRDDTSSSVYLHSRECIEDGLKHVSSCDSRLDRVILSCSTSQTKNVFDSFSPPKHDSFTSLCKSICSQQLHTKAAATIYSRVQELCGDARTGCMVPETISAASITDLQQAGLSMSKITYLKDLSDHYIRGVLGDDVLLATESLEDLKSLLLPVKGIGPWTVDMFAIFHLKRADVLPVSDLGVRKGMQKIYGLKSLPNPKEMKEIAERWKPYQSLGTWFCWRVLE
jgi:DNA-3-methyladenine glycosylase II